MQREIQDLRNKLDEIDGNIVDALAARQQVITTIGQAKLTAEGGLRDLTREQELLARLVARAKDADVDPHLVTRLFREILDHSVRRQQQNLVDRDNPDRTAADVLVVGYQGTDGANSHLVAQKHFGPRGVEVEYRGYDSFEEMLQAVHDGGCNYAMLPIENTTAGSINESYDLLARMNLVLVGEDIWKIEHCLLAIEDVPLSHIRRVYSHPQALAQCSEFLRRLKDTHVESFTDTAMAARKIRDEQDLSQAAIANAEAARIYGLHVVKQGIANQKENFTRFVVVAREPVTVDERIPCKTSVILATKHEEGALLRCLNTLADHHLNLTKLESRPRPNNPWEYLFYIDFEGNLASQQVQTGLRELTANTSYLKVLGSYPARTTRENRPAEPKPAGASRPKVPAEPKAASAPTASVMQQLEKKPYKLVSRAGRMKDTLIQVGNVTIGGAEPVVIAGPCSVESRDQIFACARVVKENGGHLLRGGCFKPRTSPYSFQGMGYEGLDILEEAGRTFGLPIVTEVMHPSDVQPVARQADILQIGARNMQNFSLLKELGKVDRPILFKRGMMADIDEWLGAAEYILAAGNQQVILCERGIRTFETATRNTLDLSAVPVCRERTHLPIIVDPSHACGTYRWIPQMAAGSLAVGAHGIMVETHPDPATAKSDGPQALTFEMFEKLMAQIHAMHAAQVSK